MSITSFRRKGVAAKQRGDAVVVQRQGRAGVRNGSHPPRSPFLRKGEDQREVMSITPFRRKGVAAKQRGDAVVVQRQGRAAVRNGSHPPRSPFLRKGEDQCEVMSVTPFLRKEEDSRAVMSITPFRRKGVAAKQRGDAVHRAARDYPSMSPTSRPTLVNAAIARSRCSRVWAAHIWVRMRAWPSATTG